MEIKELRYGNYVSIQSEGCTYKYHNFKDKIYFKKCSIYAKRIADEEILKIEIDNDQLKPLSITEDLLIRFGFKKGRLRTWQKEISEGVIAYSKGYFYFNGARFECNHVHNLQNICFALTGEELTFDKI